MKNLFVMLIQYKKEFSEIEKSLAEHREYLKKGYEKGILLASGPQNPKIGGLIIGKFDSKSEALSFSKQDPFSLKGLVSYDIIEFNPILHQDFLKDFLEN